MQDGAAEVLEHQIIDATKEQVGEKRVPQEFKAMKTFCDAVQKQKENVEGRSAMSRAQIEELFNMQWVRSTVGQAEFTDFENGWYRERIQSESSTLRVRIQSEGLATEQGDMMLNYTDIKGNNGENAVQEMLQFDSTIPGSPCRKVMINFLPGNNYQFRIWVPGEDGEQTIRGESKEDETGQTKWSFE